MAMTVEATSDLCILCQDTADLNQFVNLEKVNPWLRKHVLTFLPFLVHVCFPGFRIALYLTFAVLAGLALLFSSSLLLQILACALYNNWWPMLSALMYILVPMPCIFFTDGSTQSLISRDDDGWMSAAKFLTGASLVGSLAIPIILRHADFISTGAILIQFLSFFIFLGTVMCYYRANIEDDWSAKESSLGMSFTL